MTLNFQVQGNDLAARTILLYLLQQLPQKATITWIKPSLSQLEMSLCLSPEILQLLKYLQVPFKRLLQKGYGNLNCGANYLFWPDINGKKKGLFIPYFHESNLRAYPFAAFAKYQPPHASLLDYCLPQYPLLKAGKCPVSNTFECELPLGIQVLRAPFFDLIDDFLLQDKRLSLSENPTPSDSDTLCITTNSPTKTKQHPFESFSHFSHFGYENLSLHTLPSHQEVYFVEKGYLNVHYLPSALSLNWVGSSYKSCADITKLYQSLCSHGSHLHSSQLTLEHHRKIYHPVAENPWEDQKLRLSTHALATLPQDFSLKLLFFSLDALFHFYPDTSSFTRRFQRGLEEIYTYFQLLFTPLPSTNSFIASYQTPSQHCKDLVKSYKNTYGLVDNWKLFSASPTLLQHLLSSRGLFPHSPHPSVEAQSYTPDTLSQLKKEMALLQVPQQENISFIQSLRERSL